jgi:endonuclease/exonuclease/phosphatase family metal-dependent hydrolase
MARFRFVLQLCSTALVAVFLLGVGCAAFEGPTIRIVTWNVHGTQAGAEAIAAELRALAPDIICLQEVESGELVSPGPDQAHAIAESLGMNVVATPAPEPGSKEEQAAILARGDMEDVVFLQTRWGRHYGISAEIDLRDDSELRITCVHFTSTDWSSIGQIMATNTRRMQEVNDLVKRIEGWDDDLILAGDFNSLPLSIEHAAIDRRMEWVGSTEPTFRGEGLNLQLDHVFTKGKLKEQRIFTVPTQASDHKLLVADIHLLSRPLLAGLTGEGLFEPADDENHD